MDDTYRALSVLLSQGTEKETLEWKEVLEAVRLACRDAAQEAHARALLQQLLLYHGSIPPPPTLSHVMPPLEELKYTAIQSLGRSLLEDETSQRAVRHVEATAQSPVLWKLAHSLLHPAGEESGPNPGG